MAQRWVAPELFLRCSPLPPQLDSARWCVARGWLPPPRGVVLLIPPSLCASDQGTRRHTLCSFALLKLLIVHLSLRRRTEVPVDGRVWCGVVREPVPRDWREVSEHWFEFRGLMGLLMAMHPSTAPIITIRSS